MGPFKTLPLALLAAAGFAGWAPAEAASIAKPGAAVSPGGGGRHSGGFHHGGGRQGAYAGGRHAGYGGVRHGGSYGGHSGGRHGGHGHWHGGVAFHYGIPVWGPWYYGWASSWPYYDAWYPSPYYAPAPYPYSYPHAIADAGPPPPTTEVPPQAHGAPTQRPLYQNYCESAKAYYPKVTACPEGWRLAAPGY